MKPVLDEAGVKRCAKLMIELKYQVPGNWRPMNMLGGTLPFAAIEEADEPGRGRILFVETWDEAQLMAGALNLVEIAKGRFTLLEVEGVA